MNATGSGRLRLLSHHLRPPAAACAAEAAALPPPMAPEPRLEQLIRPSALEAFDREQFERDGYWLWAGALTDAGRVAIKDTLVRLQEMQDYMVMETPWTAIDWQRRGLPPPPADRLTAEWRSSRVCGGSEQLSYYPPEEPGGKPIGKGFLTMPIREYMAEQGLFGSGSDCLATDGWESQGHVPEFAPLCHSPFLLDLVTAHPQMMALFSKLFKGRFCLDHFLLLNRKADEGTGRHWHAHRYTDGRHEEHGEFDEGEGRAEFLERQCIRTLCYPDGARAVADGGHGGELVSRAIIADI